MLVFPNERVPLARLLKFMELGERLAHDCALAQAALAPEPGMRRFLLTQARQEGYHAVAFQGAIAWLAPRYLGTSHLHAPLERYRTLIDEALCRGDYLETILAEQIILEGLGQATLKRIEEGLVKRGAGFTRLRRLLLQQEEAHHAFGQRTLERAIAEGETSPEALRARAPLYLALIDELIRSLQGLFESIDENPAVYISNARSYLPGWLTTENPSRAGV